MATYNDSKDAVPERGYSSFLDKVYQSRLTPAEDGCWKIIFTDNYYSEGTEIQFSEEESAEISNWSKFKLIPVKNNRWKISIESTSDIIRRKKGKFDIMIHSDLLLVTIRKDGCWTFYCPSSEEYMDETEDDDESSLEFLSLDFQYYPLYTPALKFASAAQSRKASSSLAFRRIRFSIRKIKNAFAFAMAFSTATLTCE